MTIQLLGFPTTLGLPRKAYHHGPEALRTAGLVQQLEGLGRNVQDLGDMTLAEGVATDPVVVRVNKVVEAARLQADYWLRVHQPGDLMLTLGGDHSTSLGTIWALSEMGSPFDLIWIDAHGDFNIVETSPSANPHGMVLSLACGLMPHWMPQLISPANLQLWGIRDLDPGEASLLSQHQVEVISPEQARLQRDQLTRRLKPNLFLSFDIDSVAPEEAPGTMTPVPGGFRVQEVLDLVAHLARERNLLAVDIVEFHPDRDQKSLTMNLAMAVAKAATAGQICRPFSRQPSPPRTMTQPN